MSTAHIYGDPPEIVCSEDSLYGRYLVSTRLREIGFEFRFPELPQALADVLKR
jgi:NAD dependent epimerase/dehydratase family enzyme